MKILFEHNGVLPVATYGGTERLIYWMMKDLVQKGHTVYLIADASSNVKEDGINLIARQGDDWQKLIPKDVDVVHIFAPINFKLDLPYLITIGGNGQIGETFDLNTVFVSKNHAKIHGSTSYVNNALDLSEYPFNPKKKLSWNNFLFLAKAKWKVKNLKDCVTAASKSKKHLHVAGGRAWTFSSYIHSYGMVDQIKKQELLNISDALLFPVRWHEPFGLAIIEAMSAGIPVIGSKYGSLPDLITKETGIICDSYTDLEQALLENHANNFLPEQIRAYVDNNFSISRMVDDYLKLYQIVMSGKNLNAKNPATILRESPESLLNF